MKIPRLALALIALALAPVSALEAHEARTEIAAAAKAFVASLSPEQAAEAVFPFPSEERMDWHFIPRSRRGLPLKSMSGKQRGLAHALLQSALSSSGYVKTEGVITLETVLREMSGRPDYRDPERYYFTIFGAPDKQPWGWRYEGHHVSLNFTFADKDASAHTPHFFGSNPGEVSTGEHDGLRLLATEEDLARELVTSLNSAQAEKAIIMPEAPGDIFNVPGRNVTDAEGIAWTDLTETQQETLMTLIREYTGNLRPELAGEDMQRLEQAGLATLHFAWAGSLERGEAHYFRVQGGSFVLEYDNIQNNANHAHSLWRDFDHDFGNDLLGRHVREEHSDDGH